MNVIFYLGEDGPPFAKLEILEHHFQIGKIRVSFFQLLKIYPGCYSYLHLITNKRLMITLFICFTRGQFLFGFLLFSCSKNLCLIEGKGVY